MARLTPPTQALVRSLWSAGGVLFFGFGVLLTFWITGSYAPRLPGLFAYRSATVGDGLLLPLSA
ncbi:MAG: hypothetical protein LC749_05090, partial [Actinobacteria bacterium]|nr:hypothetical protein [Actinomycetota bacterium]